MNAIEMLAESYGSIDGLLHYLWHTPESLEFGHQLSIGIEYSERKQAAVLLATGRSHRYWLGLEAA